VPRTELGKGVTVVEVAVSNETRQKSSSSATSPVPLADKPVVKEEDVAKEEPVPVSAAHRILKKQDSLSAEEEAEQIAKSTKAAFDAGWLTSTDPNIPSCEYWVRAFVEIAAKLPSDVDSLESMRIYPKYVANMLLGAVNAYDTLPTFGRLLKDMKIKAPMLFPKAGVVDAVIALAEFDMKSAAELNLDFLTLNSRTVFVGSALYKEFLDKRFEAMVAAAATSTAPAEERLRTVGELLRIRGSDERLLFAQTFLGQAKSAEKIKYLLENPTRRFEFLRCWAPGHEFNGLGVLATEKYKEVAGYLLGYSRSCVFVAVVVVVSTLAALSFAAVSLVAGLASCIILSGPRCSRWTS
jgi:hypothetical protein